MTKLKDRLDKAREGGCIVIRGGGAVETGRVVFFGWCGDGEGDDFAGGGVSCGSVE